MGTQENVRQATPTLDRLSALLSRRERRNGFDNDIATCRAFFTDRAKRSVRVSDLAEWLHICDLSNSFRCFNDAAALRREVA